MMQTAILYLQEQLALQSILKYHIITKKVKKMKAVKGTLLDMQSGLQQ